ncbi:hypothetical protein D918_07913 [Trichuris suis]|nr:hypothetical protein D918_07913 [Trichuris suis]
MALKAPVEEEADNAKGNEDVPLKTPARQSNSSSPTTGSPTSEREATDLTKGESSYQTQTKASICPVAPDGYYGWVIVASSFVTNMICDGLAFSFGILFPEIQRRYGTGKGVSATVGGLFMAMPLLAGPVASSLIERRDFRKITIIGSVISFIGIFMR